MSTSSATPELDRASRLAPLLAGLTAIGPFSIDTYFPSFPALAAHFGVGAAEIQQSLSLFLLGLAIMALFHGPLSDAYGRRRVILVTISAYTLASIGCAVAPDYRSLLLLRAAQGLVAGAGMIVGQAIVRDRFAGMQAHKLMSQVTMLFGVAPAVAPVLGGYLHVWFGWRAVFVFLALMGTTLWLTCRAILPETLPAAARQSFHPLRLLAGYAEIVGSAAFRRIAVASSCAFGGFILYVASAPDFVLGVLHLRETEFAWLFVPLVIGMVGGGWLNNRIAHRSTPERLMRIGYACMSVAAIANLLISALLPAAVPWSVLPLLVYAAGVTFVAPSLTILAMDLFPARRGMAASLMSFSQTMLFTVISAVLTPRLYASAWRHALAMAALLGLSLLAWRAIRRASGFRVG